MINNLLIYLFLNFLVFFLISKLSYKLYLVDIPTKRKMHTMPTAYTGGVALSIILIFAVFLFNYSNQKLDLILSIGFLIAIIGFVDDRYNLSVGSKLSLQLIPIIFLIIFENLNLNHIGDYNYFNLELNSISIPFSLLSILFLINSFNYIDGLNGTLSFLSISVLIILFYLVPEKSIQLFLITLLIPMIFFLFFNFSIFKLPRLFLGDSGSLSIGFIIGFTLIYLANNEIVAPILLAFSISFFVYEFLSINLIRILNKKKLFIAGKDHIHHVLYKKNKSLFLTNFLISTTNIIFFILGYLTFKLINPLTSFILFIFLFIVFFIFRNKWKKY